MSKTLIEIGPKDAGRRMSLDDFEYAKARVGYRYELSRGVIVVTEVPNPPHAFLIMAIKDQLHAHHLANPGQLQLIAGGSECKILVRGLESERHPDLAVFKKPPASDKSDAWEKWVPELVIEVVSPGSEHRDYEEKREEYLLVGVREYWIVNPDGQEIVVLRRVKDRWSERVVRPPELCHTRLLPGFALDCGKVFAAWKPGR